MIKIRNKLLVEGIAMVIAGLCIVGQAEAATIVNNTITVGAVDVFENQDPTGYDFRYSYSSVSDAYYQNGNFTTPDAKGWATALAGGYQSARFDYPPGEGPWGLGRDPSTWPKLAGTPAVFTWRFDFTGTGRTIEQLSVRATRLHQYPESQDHKRRSTLEVSKEGTNYTMYADDIPTRWTQYNEYHDLTTYVKGSSVYYIRATIYPHHHADVILFLGQDYAPQELPHAAFDNKVWLAPAADALTKPVIGATELQCSQVSDSFDIATQWREWERLPAVRLEPWSKLEADGDIDLSGKLTLAWNSRYFFIIVRVRDDLFRPSDSVSGFWNGDSIQFAFAPLNNTLLKEGGDGRFFWGAADFSFGRKAFTTAVPDGYPKGILDVPFDVHHNGTLMTYIIALPWCYMGKIDPLLDEPFRFNLIVNENDGAKRLGWLQLSDGIGDGSDVLKFRLAKFLRSESDYPQVHVIMSRPAVEISRNIDLVVTVRDVTADMKIRVEVGNHIQEQEIPTGGGVKQMALSVPAGKVGIENVPVRVVLVNAEGGVVAESETAVLINDANKLSAEVAQARDILNRVNALIEQEQAKGRIVDYFRLRAFCIGYSLRVVDLTQREYRMPDGTTSRYGTIYKDAVRYVSTVTPKLLADILAFVEDSGSPQLAIPKSDILQPWTVRSGNIYAGAEPITLHGVVWLYIHKDGSYSLYDMGLNMQTIDIGSQYLVAQGAEGFELVKDVRNVSAVEHLRRIGIEGQNWGEVFELHTSPHYTPSWFKQDNHNAWFDTPDGRRLLELMYQGQSEVFKDIRAIKAADLANEWTFWSTSSEAMSGFRQWLEQLYGSPENLNERWQTDFQSFGQVPVPFSSDKDGLSQPLTPEGIYQRRGPYWDWCSYNTQRAAGVVQWMQTTFHKYLPDLLTQIKCVFSSREYRTLADSFIVGIDPQKILPITDFIGTDASYIRGTQWKGTLFAYDYMKSICPDKPIVCTETHAMPYDDGMAPAEIRRGLFQRFVHGERLNLMFFLATLAQWEWWGGDFEGGSTSFYNIGASPEALESFALTSADLRRLTRQLCFFTQRQPDVLIFYDNAADFGVPKSITPPGQYQDRALRVYESLLYHDVKVGMVTEGMFAEQLPRASLIILCGAQFVSDQTVSALKNYLLRGGRIVWLGDNLQFDHYGKARGGTLLKALVESERVNKIPLDPAVYDSAWPQVLAQAKVRYPFETVSKDGKIAWGVEILSTQETDGRPLVFLTNTSNVSKNFALRCRQPVSHKFTDLVTASVADPDRIHLQSNQVMLLQGELKPD